MSHSLGKSDQTRRIDQRKPELVEGYIKKMPELWDKRAKQFLVLSGLILLLFVFFRVAKYYADILAIFGISVLLAYLLINPVDWVTRVVKIRAIAVVLVYLFIIGFLIAVAIFVAPKVIKEFTEFTHQIPEIINSMDRKAQNLQTYLNKNNIPINLFSTTNGLSTKFGKFTVDSIGNILGVALSTFHIVFYILVTAVTSFYFLLDGHKIAHELTKCIPNKYRGNIHELLIELDRCLRGFYGGMVKLAVVNATVMFTTYLIMKVPYALLLALLHLLAFVIPVVGGWLGLIPALIVIAFTDPTKIWIPIVVYESFTRLIQDNLISPKIMGDAIGMHPVIVLIAVLAGLKTAGLIGIVFALPIFGVANVILKHSLKNLGDIS